MKSTDGAGLDSVISIQSDDRGGELMETAHSHEDIKVSAWERVLACLAILLTAALLIYLS
jgi:hypothetical protein